MTKAEQIRERIDALVADGLSKADAFRQLASDLGLTPKGVQGSYYTATRKANGGSSRPRTRETTAADAVESAKAVLIRAIDTIDAEIEAAAERAAEAAAEHQALKASAAKRKQEITAKLEALS